MLENSLKRCIEAAMLVLRQPAGRTMRLENAARVLRSDSSPATLTFVAAETLLGEMFLTWEPDSIWTALADKDLDISEINRNKLLAVGTLLQTPAFFWDANLYEDTCLAFDNAPVIVDVIQEASPAQLSWGVFEAQTILMGRDNPTTFEFDHEPRQYSAVSLFRDGLVLAPSLLVFCQEELDSLTRSEESFRFQVLQRWNELKNAKADIAELELVENQLDTQIAKLAAVELYLGQKAEHFLSEISKL